MRCAVTMASDKSISAKSEDGYVFHGRRKGRPLRKQRQSAMDFIEAQGYLLSPNDAPAIFQDLQNFKAIWFEVGFGNGEHLAWHALQNPDILMIGCEPFINGVSALARQIMEQDIKNIRIWPDDANLLMAKIPENTLDRFFILHPDPWPKTRHHRRRFVQTDRLTKIAKMLKNNAELRLASDDPDLVDWMLDKTFHHPNFIWQAEKPDDWLVRPADWPQTRYEKKALEGRPYYLSFLCRK